jgi:hypothetical protein
MSDGGLNHIEEEIRDADYFEKQIIEVAERVSDLEEIVEEIKKLIINAYKAVSKEKQNDK